MAWLVLKHATPLALLSRSAAPTGHYYELAFMSGWLGGSFALLAVTRLDRVLSRSQVAARIALALGLSAIFTTLFALLALAACGESGVHGLIAPNCLAGVVFPTLVAGVLCGIPKTGPARGLIYWSIALLWNLGANRALALEERVPSATILPIVGLALALATLSLPTRDRLRRTTQVR